jgi:hypothetical protein
MSPSQKRRRRGFEYSPLQFNTFRLLELICGQSLYADIHCRLRNYQLDSAPPYEALSYTWGDEESACRISLGGLPFHIRPNLLDALWRLRQPRSTRIIWIDALCIDQNSADEKSVQVRGVLNVFHMLELFDLWRGGVLVNGAAPTHAIAQGRRYLSSGHVLLNDKRSLSAD